MLHATQSDWSSILSQKEIASREAFEYALKAPRSRACWYGYPSSKIPSSPYVTPASFKSIFVFMSVCRIQALHDLCILLSQVNISVSRSRMSHKRRRSECLHSPMSARLEFDTRKLASTEIPDWSSFSRGATPRIGSEYRLYCIYKPPSHPTSSHPAGYAPPYIFVAGATSM